jgi:eukaryotic-like serine/threonine-protein kinase
MTESSDREQVFRVFSEAMDLEPPARDAFVQERCGRDADLLREVAALLAVAETDSGATGMLLGGAEPSVRNLIGAEYGRFRLQELIGSGGMGVVYSAVRTDGVPQTVAIKLLRGAISAESSARFVSEAKLLARLKHPAIAQLIDVGVKDGEGWLAVELVRGRPIDEYCDANHLDLRQRVKLLAAIAAAVATAHRSLVVHRDIKPTNVLVDDDGHPKLIDFGIASTLSDSSGAREPTADIRRLFTPHYAAPEQVKGEPVTVATDVFGLGALGYRLLCGRAPFAEATSPASYLYAVTQQDLEAPSRAAQSVDLARSHRLRGDLDAILMKALERDPARRYLSALDFQRDLHRYLDGLPVSAHAPSLRYRLTKLARRHALVAALGVVLMLALIAGGVIYGLQAHSVAQARNAALRRGEFLERLLKSADPTIGKKDVTVAELLDTADKQLAVDSTDEPQVTASMYELIAETDRNLGRTPQGLAANDHALALLRQNGGRSSDLATALGTRGGLLINGSRYLDAVAPLQEAIQRLRGESAQKEALADDYDLLGQALSNAGSHNTEAEAAFRSSIDAYNSIHSPHVGSAFSSLGNLFNNEGRYPESEALQRQALAALEHVLSPDHPEILSIKNNLAAQVMLHDHRPAEAEVLFRQIYQSRLRVLGPDHPDTQFSAATVADSLSAQQRYADAAPLALGAAQTLERVAGPDQAWTLYALQVYGAAACHSGQEAAGLAALQRATAAREKLYGAADWRTTSSRMAIGECFLALKRYAEAEPILLQTVPQLEKLQGAKARRTQSGYGSLRDLYLALGRPDQAALWAGKILP